ncbi:MAG: N-methyl-L-tryptophan oxidase [Hyphomicrobiales bacterium]|jgi:sarcosine oxidase|nr:N-methyl-L-tryptophan oxidase [Hyphomicrobiales bacterium]
MSDHYDVIVAGVGGMGSAACWELAKRGQRVLGLERFDIGHAMGSSHGMTRIIRLAYFEGSHYVPIVRRAHELWQETGRRADTQLLYVTGSVDLAPEGAGFVESSLQSCLDHGLTHQLLNHAQIKARFPAFNLPKGHVGLWQPDGGFVASERAIYAHVGLAQAAGATIRANEPVLDWSTTAHGGVKVTTARGTYTAGRLVLTSGAWMDTLNPALAPHIKTVRQAIGWYTVRNPEPFRIGNVPVFILTVDEGNFYGFPLWEHPGFKLGGPHFGREPIDPSQPDRTPTERQAKFLRDAIETYFPDASPEPLALKGCIYTVTPDEHFVIDTIPGAEQVVFASCCSGHGYKFASAIGEILADLSVTGACRFDLSAFSLSRFTRAA